MIPHMIRRCALLALALWLPETAAAQPIPLPEAAVVRFGASRMRHAEEIRRVAWLPDQKRIATRTARNVAMWDITTGRRLWQVPLAGGQERLLEYVAPGGFITADSEGLCFLDEAGKIRSTLSNEGRRPWNVAVSGNGKQLLVVWEQGSTMLYELTEKGAKEPGRQLAKGRVYAPQFTADGEMLIFTTTKEVELWDVKKLVRRRTYEANDHPVSYHSSRISPDGKWVMAIGGESFRFWQADQAKEWHKFADPNFLPAGAYDFGFTQDSKSFVMAISWGHFACWSMLTGKREKTVEMPYSVPSTGHMQLSPDAKNLAVLQGNELSLWDTSAGKPLKTIDGPPLLFARFVAPDRILSVGEDQLLRWHEPGKGQLSKVQPKLSGTDWDRGLFSSDGRWWVQCLGKYVQINDRIFVGNVQEGSKPTHYNLNTNVIDYTFSGDSNDLLTSDEEGTWFVWNPQQITQKRRFAAVVPSRLDYSLNNQYIAVYVKDGGAVAVYAAKTGQRRFLTTTIHDKSELVGAFRFSPSSQYVAIGHAEVLCVVSNIHGRILFRRPMEPELRVPEQVLAKQPALGKQAVAFSPDERWLVLGHVRSSKLHLYDLDAACLPGYGPQTVEAHPGGVTGVDLSPDGKYLLTTGKEGTVLVWDTKRLFKPAETPAALKEIKLPGDWWAGLRQSKDEELSGLMVAMIHQPEKTVALLAKHLKTVAEPDAKIVQQWVAELKSEQFIVRETAARSLADLGELAAPALSAALEKKPYSVDFERRVKSLLAKLEKPEAQPDRLRRFCAIELLERIGTPAARELLLTLSKGASGASVTIEAADALRRLDYRAALTKSKLQS